MTIKALHGGKLLCLMAAVAGAMTLGSCKDDDNDDDEPEPAPVVPTDTTPKVTSEFKFRLNDSTIAVSENTIKANTLLNDGVNSDKISVDAVLSEAVNASSVSFTLYNESLGKVNVSGNPSITGTIYSISFPAIEGDYTLNINGMTKSFSVAGTGNTTSANRNLSNKYTVSLDSINKSFNGIEYASYEKTELTSTIAHMKSSNGKFIVLTEEEYNKYLTSALSFVKGDIGDKAPNEKTLLALNDVKYFVYKTDNINYICNIVDFAGAEVANATLKLEITY